MRERMAFMHFGHMLIHHRFGKKHRSDTTFMNLATHRNKRLFHNVMSSFRYDALWWTFRNFWSRSCCFEVSIPNREGKVMQMGKFLCCSRWIGEADEMARMVVDYQSCTLLLSHCFVKRWGTRMCGIGTLSNVPSIPLIAFGSKFLVLRSIKWMSGSGCLVLVCVLTSAVACQRRKHVKWWW